MSSKRLLIVRHAHRNKPFGRLADNGLSGKGNKQAKRLARFLPLFLKDEAPVLLSSPKIRCVQTLVPLAQKLNLSIKNSPEFLEQKEEAEAESDADFENRVHQFFKAWKKSSSPLTLVCSHGDWIPLFLKIATGVKAELDKGGFAEIEWDKKPGSARLTWLVQNLKFRTTKKN